MKKPKQNDLFKKTRMAEILRDRPGETFEQEMDRIQKEIFKIETEKGFRF